VFDGSNRHMVKGDVPAMTEDLNQLGQLILHGTDDSAGWSEVYDLIEQWRLVESERKHMVEMSLMIRVDDPMLLITAIAEVVKRYVTTRACWRPLLRNSGG
jgi:hypothetical protein